MSCFSPRFVEKSGFQREGLLRQVAFRGGAWRDYVANGLLRDERVRLEHRSRRSVLFAWPCCYVAAAAQ